MLDHRFGGMASHLAWSLSVGGVVDHRRSPEEWLPALAAPHYGPSGSVTQRTRNPALARREAFGGRGEPVGEVGRGELVVVQPVLELFGGQPGQQQVGAEPGVRRAG